MDSVRKIRLMDQRKRGAGGWVVFYTIPPGDSHYSGRIGYDTSSYIGAQAAKAALIELPEEEWTYDKTWAAAQVADAKAKMDDSAF